MNQRMIVVDFDLFFFGVDVLCVCVALVSAIERRLNELCAWLDEGLLTARRAAHVVAPPKVTRRASSSSSKQSDSQDNDAGDAPRLPTTATDDGYEAYDWTYFQGALDALQAIVHLRSQLDDLERSLRQRLQTAKPLLSATLPATMLELENNSGIFYRIQTIYILFSFFSVFFFFFLLLR